MKKNRIPIYTLALAAISTVATCIMLYYTIHKETTQVKLAIPASYNNINSRAKYLDETLKYFTIDDNNKTVRVLSILRMSQEDYDNLRSKIILSVPFVLKKIGNDYIKNVGYEISTIRDINKGRGLFYEEYDSKNIIVNKQNAEDPFTDFITNSIQLKKHIETVDEQVLAMNERMVVNDTIDHIYYLFTILQDNCPPMTYTIDNLVYLSSSRDFYYSFMSERVKMEIMNYYSDKDFFIVYYNHCNQNNDSVSLSNKDYIQQAYFSGEYISKQTHMNLLISPNKWKRIYYLVVFFTLFIFSIILYRSFRSFCSYCKSIPKNKRPFKKLYRDKVIKKRLFSELMMLLLIIFTYVVIVMGLYISYFVYDIFDISSFYQSI